MVDVVKYEARLRYRAKRLGYSVMLTRGLENRRREASGIGAFMLLGQDGVALHAATFDDIAKFLQDRDRAPKTAATLSGGEGRHRHNLEKLHGTTGHVCRRAAGGKADIAHSVFYVGTGEPFVDILP